MGFSDVEGRGPAVAVVGAGCRLPGDIADLAGLWSALDDGRDLVGEVPDDRFDVRRFVDPAAPRPGKSYTAAGGFLSDIAGFDAAYFGISPREAAQMDPQHRLLLELAVEALDDAGIPASSLAGSDTGVFIGMSDHSYGTLQLSLTDDVDPYTMLGAASALGANRLSHVLDLRGPSMAIDTACSSSLVALDRACRFLAEGGGRAVLAGGVNILTGPLCYVGFAQAAMLSKRGRCAAFSARADGFVRAEGGGVVVLKRLADALADGDRVHAVIRGSGTNCDGRTQGVALPSASAQERLLRTVYGEAGVDPDDLVYFEAHGTGTQAGDPVEARAVGNALGRRRGGGALPLGSVKSNLGHLEPASGVAGLFKALLVLRHGHVPASLHASPLHPDIDFAGLGLAPAVEPHPVTVTERSAVGVNSFGFGGANAHVVLTPPPAPAPLPRQATPADGRPLPVLVSARSARALREAAARVSERLATAGPEEFYDLARTSCLRRDAHPHRAVVFATGAPEAAARLTHLFGGDEGPEATPRTAATGPAGPADPTGPADSADSAEAVRSAGAVGEATGPGGVTFVFSGNGSQWPGMAADLMAREPVFRAAVDEADTALAPHLGWSVAKRLETGEAHRWERTEIAQPMLFTVQTALVALLADRGVRPAAVIGHSVGEVAAAHTAGALDLPSAARVIAERSRAQAATTGSGRMAAVGLGEADALAAIAPYEGLLEIAGTNSARDVTVAGDPDALADLGDRLAARQVFFRDLDLDHAFHSAAMDPLREPLAHALTGLTPTATRLPMISTVTGAPVRGEELTADYWWRNVREPVRFARAVEHALTDGPRVVLEVGPHPVLRPYVRRATGAHAPVAYVPTLHRDSDGVAAVADALAALAAAGAGVDWNRHFPHPARPADLPAYPWQRERHWNGTPEQWVLRTGGDGRVDHPLLGERIPAPQPLWSGAVDPALVPWLAGHRVAGTVVMPATGYVEMALAAGRRTGSSPVEVSHLRIERPLAVPWPDPGRLRTQVTLTPDDGILTITSTDARAAEPRAHVRARVRALLDPRPEPLDPTAVRDRCRRTVTGPDHYRTCERAGLSYGPAFQVLTELRVGRGEVLAAYRHAPAGDGREPREYEVHPALLDGALQAGAPLLYDDPAARSAHLPSAVGAVRVWRTPAATGLVHVRERSRTATDVCWDVTVTDDDGTVTVEMEGCRLRRLTEADPAPLMVRRTELRAAPRPGDPAPSAPPPTPSGLAAAAAERIAALRTAWRDMPHDRFSTRAKEALAHVWAEVLDGFLPGPGTAFDTRTLIRCGLRSRHRSLVDLMLPALERHGLLAPLPDGRWYLTDRVRRGGELLRALVSDHPAFSAEAALCARRARHLDALLRGTRDPMELVAADAIALEHVYDLSPVTRFHNRIAQTLVRSLVAAWPADRPLRVLEVGAGTGGTTAALLPLLPPERTHYTYTDVSAAFLTRAEHRFAAYDFLDHRTLDLDTDPTAQGFPEGAYDLVVSAHALHTTTDLTAALRRVRALLAPGGLLLALEPHDPEELSGLFGTLESFWQRADTHLRPHSVLLARDQWPPLLAECGFTDVVVTGDDRRPTGESCSVLLAAAPTGDPAPPPPPAAPGPDTAWAVAVETDEESEAGRALADRLREATGASADGASASRPAAAVLTAAAGSAPETLAGLLASGAREVTLVLLFAAPETDPVRLTAQATRRTALLRDLAGVCRDGLPEDVTLRLWLVTRPSGLLPAPENPAFPGDAAVWGTARTLANEQPRLGIRRVSLERGDDLGADARRLVAELLDPGDEDEIVLTRGGRFVPRESHARPGLTRPGLTRSAAPAGPFTLRVCDPGLGYRLGWERATPARPGTGQVTIAVRAAGLNYRDTLTANGLLPPEAVEGTPTALGPGLECAGVVTEVGRGVTRWAVGDRVYGLAPAALASHTVTSERSLGRVPEGMGFAEAATLPVVHATVHHGLHRLARLAPGETVLVHGGAGGIGIATLQYARAHGARLIATAGTEAKRDWLRAQGVAHVLDSRGLDFAPEVRRLTDGTGVDVVVNSLAGEALARSLELLRPGGRFVELGKRDILEDRPLPMRPFDRNIAFFGVDLNTLPLDAPGNAGLFAEVADRVAAGTYRPLPYTAYPAARVEEAFRLLQHSRHTGKVVVTFDPLDEPVPVTTGPDEPCLDPSGTYLVTGGLGGFGAATANRLARLGAGHLALVSRRGERAPEAEAVLARLAERGVRATAYAADITDPDAVRRLLRDVDATGHPLRGVVHCAMHLDDAPLTELTDERTAAVLAPKTTGGALLDRLTRDRPLDLFVAYSSLTASVGNVGQAPYAAGNAYLEALARHRAAAGLPATTLAWGAIADTGYVARHDLEHAVARRGMVPAVPDEALTAAGPSLVAGTAVAGVERCEWGRVKGLLPLLGGARFRALVPDATDDGDHARADLPAQLAHMAPQEAEAAITAALVTLLAGVLHMSGDGIDPSRRLEDYGMDSLMGAELLVAVRNRFDLVVSPAELMGNGLTLADIARLVHQRLTARPATPAPATTR
ncbi:SDR family NAD(P)-dependent oxidoreductase [Streptomyces sp. NPDC016309]|uniref:SDR family NAD(P)-dependent oxidoreductase n=1 Tax=Streptomyces sp. NPDC016309 TaxID=3364965 RepID=UPI0036FAC74F